MGLYDLLYPIKLSWKYKLNYYKVKLTPFILCKITKYYQKSVIEIWLKKN